MTTAVGHRRPLKISKYADVRDVVIVTDCVRLIFETLRARDRWAMMQQQQQQSYHANHKARFQLSVFVFPFAVKFGMNYFSTWSTPLSTQRTIPVMALPVVVWSIFIQDISKQPWYQSHGTCTRFSETCTQQPTGGGAPLSYVVLPCRSQRNPTCND